MMVVAANAASEVAAVNDVVHIVTWWQWFLDKAVGLKVPHSLCGTRLAGDRDNVDLLALEEPLCERCVAQVKRRRWH